MPFVLPDAVVQKLEALPAQPGVYLFKDKKGTVVYVGKAKSLRSRVRQYFQSGQGDARPFIPVLQRTIGDLETLVTANEKEAAILENNLIKENRPRYNVKLRDDKDFITLRLGFATLAAESPPSAGGGAEPPLASPELEGQKVEAPRPESSGAEGRRIAGGGAEERATAGRGKPQAGAWPRLEVVRRPSPDGARYFGPYHSATAARRTLQLVNKHFQLRTCSDTELASRKRPCLQHQIKRCPAPCVLQVDRGWYAEQVDAVRKFLEGRHDELSRELEAKMKRAAREMRFELAAVYRDQLRAIEKVRQEQRVVTVDDVDRDVLGFYREGELVEIALLHVRAGKLQDVGTYSIKQAEIPDEEIVAAFVAQHYTTMGGSLAADVESGAGAELVPDEIILPREPEGVDGIAEWLSDRARHKVTLVWPKRGHRVDLLAMANENARHSFVEKQRHSDDVQERLRDMQERLRLPALPRRIECCDISHLGGGDTVGAIVAMNDGELDKKRYRTFNVRGGGAPRGMGILGGALSTPAARGASGQGPGDPAHVPGLINDDYASMYEVLARRFQRALQAEALPQSLGEGSAERESDATWDVPDLFVVDGGRGQLGVALAAAHDLGIHDLPIVGLAKERENVAGETLVDRVYLPGQKNPVPLKSTTTSLFLLARLRDEAHRFSNYARERLGKRRRFHSPLDEVRGLGERAKKALLTHIGNLAAIVAADDAALLAVPGVTQRHVKAIRAAYPRDPPPAAGGGAVVPAPSPDGAPPTEAPERQRG